MPATTDPAVPRVPGIPGPHAFGVPAAVGMARAEAEGSVEAVAACALAGVRESELAEGPLAERELRPLGGLLPGWYAYRGPDRRHGSGNLQQVTLAMRASVVLKRLGFLPDRPTLILPAPAPENEGP